MAFVRSSILVFLASSLPYAIAASQCYFPDGTEATGDRPCRDIEGSPCCGVGYRCFSNGLCQDGTFDESDLHLDRGSCTDSSWESDSCPKYCIAQSIDYGSDVFHCGTSHFVCGNDLDLCNSEPGFDLDGTMYVVTLITDDEKTTISTTSSTVKTTTLSTEETTSASTSETTISKPDASSKTSTPEAASTTNQDSTSSEKPESTTQRDATFSSTAAPGSSTSSDKQDTTQNNTSSSPKGPLIGGAVGGVLGGLIFGGLAVFLCLRRRNRSRRSGDPVGLCPPRTPSPDKGVSELHWQSSETAPARSVTIQETQYGSHELNAAPNPVWTYALGNEGLGGPRAHELDNGGSGAPR